MLDNSKINAIFCARGGYGTLRIVDQLNFSKFMEHPKWICGYSDITVLHSHINKNCGVATIHATMPVSMGEKGEREKGEKESFCENIETLYQTLMGENIVYQCVPHELNRVGECSGQLTGGNLSLLYALSGSVSDMDTAGKILFIEDVDEYLYHLDRMMLQLKRAGKLKNLAGLLVGSFTKMRDNEIPFGKTYQEIIREHCEEYDFPIAFNFPAGHDEENVAMKLGGDYTLKVGIETTILM
jgi:muramoyltetrapeptide carboxypeptidase